MFNHLNTFLKKLYKIEIWDFLHFIESIVKWIFVVSFGLLVVICPLWLMINVFSWLLKNMLGGLI